MSICNRGLLLPLTRALAHPTLLYHSRHDRSREGRERKEVRLGAAWAWAWAAAGPTTCTRKDRVDCNRGLRLALLLVSFKSVPPHVMYMLVFTNFYQALVIAESTTSDARAIKKRATCSFNDGRADLLGIIRCSGADLECASAPG